MTLCKCAPFVWEAPAAEKQVMGREPGVEGIHAFMNVKTLWIGAVEGF